MSLLRLSAVLSLVLVWLTGCEPAAPAGTSATGAMRLAIALPMAAPGDVSRVTVTVSGSDMASQSTDLMLTDGAWGGVLGRIPAGERRTFKAQAFNAANVLRYEGRAEDVTVTAGVTGLVSLMLQDVTLPPPFTNEAPLVDSLVATPTSVVPGGTVSLSASAHDPNAGDSVSYAWTAPAGSFAAPTQASTTWTASMTQGVVKLSLTVSDSRGAALTVSLTVTVSAGSGAQEVRVDFNTVPGVVGLTSSQSVLDVGQQTALSVSASDADGDTLSYQWSATCAGSFSGATSSSATFTPSALPTGACNNCQLSVVVKDGRGGQNTGSLALCVTKDAIPRIPASWNPTSSMATVRGSPQATLLLNGKVLVTGGYTNNGAVATAEVYDPATGSWSPTGSMSQVRGKHTATRLLNGKVLVTGGGLSSADEMKTELYDPATGRWSPTGSLSVLHSNYRATLLSNGKVLISGGSYETAEVYDPATGSWTSAGSMVLPRYSPSATLLPSGKVLVAGGTSIRGGDQSTAEVYDPTSNTWSPTGSMSIPRSSHTATLLPSGKVLVSGGYHVGSGNQVMAEVYDPATGTWSPAGSMSTPRSAHTATLLPSGKVLVSGGFDMISIATAELYDPATGTWSSTATMLFPRYAHPATLLSTGKVLVMGGSSDTDYHASAELYDPGT
ncbi:kelch-like protein [Archangium minus]|uniref:Kelch-like protein n=1 Tax=Archangium minus TaxID=83450 RepID=A0ABY9WW87_9BACT|nr:kelch-like protein [Archangium minus]